MNAASGARARVRAELTREIKEGARAQIAAHGAPGLSLRAVARELGMVSSALYRYFPSRDDLLTALIVDAYEALATAAEAADAACRRGDFVGRWRAVCRAVHRWAQEHPHEYALIFGSPVPGYRAPEETIEPAARLPGVLCRLMVDAVEAGAIHPPATSPTVSPKVRADARRLAAAMMPGVPVDAVVRALVSWTQLFGLVSFELFGHLVGSVTDYDAFFEQSCTVMAQFLGLAV